LEIYIGREYVKIIMVDIFPVPDDLLLWHGLIKLFCAGLCAVLFVLLLIKYQKKHTRIALGFLYIFIFLILSAIFSAFDTVIGWKDLMGKNTWLGFGIGQIFNALANIVYFWLYIEIFRVKEAWKPKQKLGFMIFAVISITCSTLMMTYYLIQVPADIFIITIIYMGLTTIIYLVWIMACLNLLKTIDDPKYKEKFQYLLQMAIIFFILILILAVAGISENPSFLTWIGMVLLVCGIYFAYKGIIQEVR
jgi:hypothetical protein